MKKTILILIMTLTLILIAGCTAEPIEVNETINETPKYYGEIVNFSFASTNLSVDDSIVINSENYSGPIYLYTYCDIPIGVLEKKNNYYSWVYPDIRECAEPENGTFTPNMTIPLNSIFFKDGSTPGPGEYRIKLFYSTFAPDTYMRESNTEIEVN